MNSERNILDALLSTEFESAEISSPDLIAWLSAQREFPKYYFRPSDSEIEIAASGSILTLSELNCSSQSEAADLLTLAARRHPQRDLFLAVAGSAFDSDQNLSNTWRGFSKFCFYIPKMFILREGAQFKKISVRRKADRLGNIPELNQEIHPLRSNEDDLLHSQDIRVDLPNFADWSIGIQRSLELIENGDLDKIVLARKSVIRTYSNLDPFLILSELRAVQVNCAPFFFSPNPELAFLGVSPERLFALKDGTLTSEAVGGTASLFGQSIEQTIAHLSSDKKTLLEHELVVAYLIESLNMLCESVSTDAKPGARVLNDLIHLRTFVRAKLKESTSVGALLKALHPTPAVCGLPISQARQIIRKIEGFHRGWYAGYMGYLRANQAEFNVTIRSLLLNKDIVALFAGAGIVAGSDARSEWEEIERKIYTPLNMLRKLSRIDHLAPLASVA